MASDQVRRACDPFHVDEELPEEVRKELLDPNIYRRNQPWYAKATGILIYLTNDKASVVSIS
jgi:hypothetical protein